MRNDLNTLTNVYEYLADIVREADGKIHIATAERNENDHRFWTGVKSGLEVARDKVDTMRQVEENRG